MELIALASGLLLVPIADQSLKRILRQHLATGTVRLGSLGCLRIMQTRVWLARPWGTPNQWVLWVLWAFAAAMLIAVTFHLTTSAWFVGLLLGGSLSHAVETSVRGGVTDYICLRFWPAFNFADVAITIGGIGIVIAMLGALRGLSS